MSITLMGVQKVLLVPWWLSWVQRPCLWYRSTGFWLWGHLRPGQGSGWGTDGVCCCYYSLSSHPDSAGAAVAAGGGWGAQATVPTAAIAVSTTKHLGGHHKVYTGYLSPYAKYRKILSSIVFTEKSMAIFNNCYMHIFHPYIL